jgi:dihydrofolate reductase
MKITLVVAVSANNVIGRDGSLPWRLPEDLRRFRQLTMGKPVIMGRRTFDSIGRALPGRRNIVVSRRCGLELAGCEVAGSPDEALARVPHAAEVMIIGGESVYRALLPRADCIERTRVHAAVEGDTFFPDLDAAAWEITRSEGHAANASRPLAFTFETLQRRRQESERAPVPTTAGAEAGAERTFQDRARQGCRARSLHGSTCGVPGKSSPLQPPRAPKLRC